MIVPEFVSYYHYNVTDTLNEYARTFFALSNSMYRLKANRSLSNISEISAALSKDKSSVINDLVKQSKGLSGIVEEVRIAKGIINDKH